MIPYYVNVVVGSADHNGDLSPIEYCVVYRFDNWKEASNFIKLSLDNGHIVEVRIPEGK